MMKKNKGMWSLGLLFTAAGIQFVSAEEPAVLMSVVDAGVPGTVVGGEIRPAVRMSQNRNAVHKLTPKEQLELKNLESQRASLEKQLTTAQGKLEATRFNPVLSMLQRDALTALAKGDTAEMQKLVKAGLNVNIPIHEYTLLMQCSDSKMAKFLVEQCGADVNEAVWQPRWGHYITALDCVNWRLIYSDKSALANAQAFVTYLKQKGAKSVGDLGFLSQYHGDYVLSSVNQTIRTVSKIKGQLSAVWKQIAEIQDWLMPSKMLPFNNGDLFRDAYRPQNRERFVAFLSNNFTVDHESLKQYLESVYKFTQSPSVQVLPPEKGEELFVYIKEGLFTNQQK